jgi:hypothetical protein
LDCCYGNYEDRADSPRTNVTSFVLLVLFFEGEVDSTERSQDLTTFHGEDVTSVQFYMIICWSRYKHMTDFTASLIEAVGIKFLSQHDHQSKLHLILLD